MNFKILSYSEHKTKIKVIFFLCILIGIISSAAQYIQAIYMGDIVDSVKLGGETVSRLFIIILITMIIEISSNITFEYFAAKQINAFIAEIQKKICRCILYLPLSEVEKKEDGEYISILTNDITAVESFMLLMMRLGYLPVKIIVSLCMIFIINYKLAICLIISMAVLIFIGNIFSSRLYELNKGEYTIKSKTASLFVEMLGYLNIIKSYNLENLFQKKNEDVISSLTGQRNRTGMLISFIQVYNRIVGILPFVILYLLGAFFVLHKEITIGNIISISFLVGLLSDGLNTLSSYPSSYFKFKAAFERIQGITEYQNPIISLKNEDKAENHQKAIVANDVCFSYDGARRVLDNISFSIEKGEKVLVAGKSGSGKTTLFKLLAGLYLPDDGEIIIDGQDTGKAFLEHCPLNLSAAIQEQYMFNDTVKANIMISDKAAGEEKFHEVCKTVFVDEFVSSLKDGYDTKISGINANFSKGQIQRINLARAFIKESDIFLLDEPTSALDIETHNRIFELITSMKGKTMVVISHLLDHVEEFDRIFYIDDTRLTEYTPAQFVNTFSNKEIR